MIRTFFSFLLLLAILVNANAQNHIYFKSGLVNADRSEINLVDHSAFSEFPVNEDRYFGVATVERIPTSTERKEIEELGLNIIRSIPRNAYYVSFDNDIQIDELKNYGVTNIIPLRPEYKLSMDLASGEIPDHAKVSSGQVSINVYYFPDVDHASALSTIQAVAQKTRHVNRYAHRIRCDIKKKDLAEIASIPYVFYVEAIDPPAEPENLVGRTDHRSNSLVPEYSTGGYYDGTDVHVIMQDDGIIGPHIDYKGRVDQQNVGSSSGDHGDHVAGTIMGAGNLEPIARGMAFGADLFVYRAAPSYPGFDTIQDVYFADSIRITSTSYSNGCNDGYTGLSSTLDQQVNDFPALMHVFSAGNSGTSDCGYGAGSNWGNITGGHKVAKNVIAVGNLDYEDNLRSSSSRGPAEDGRLKPDVCAVGTNVYSTVDPYDYDFKTGTSMSCPGTAGTLAQLYQAYRELNGGQDPNGGMMKALLMNTADDLGDPGPDFEFGYGRINGRNALNLLKDDNIILDSVDQGGNNVHSIIVPAGQKKLKIMIYWVDPAAPAASSVALINDLNMQVTDPLGSTLDPWVLDHTPNAANLDAPATRGRDSLNNVEQVTLNDPDAGTYLINIEGYGVPQGPQPYYIIWQYYDGEVTLTYPNGGEPTEPNDTETIRWDSKDSTNSFDLEYTIDNGTIWNSIATVNGDLRHYDWQVPNSVTGLARVRITQGASTDMSDSTFSIIGVPANVAILWVCPDSLMLTWDTVPGAVGYEISQLGAKYMDSIAYTTADSIVLTGIPAPQEHWFSVKALGSEAVGRRARAVQKVPGVVDCPAPQDAMLEMVLAPAEGTISTCFDLSAVPVKVLLVNSGIDSIMNVPVNYRLDGGSIVSETFMDTLAPGEDTVYTFMSPVDISATGLHTIEAWTSLTNDDIVFNDSVYQTTTVVSATSVPVPWTEDFETFPFCSSANDCEAVDCGVTNDWVNEENLVVDDIDWRGDNDGTPSSSTGPDEDHNPGTNVGKYMFLEASGDCNFRTGLFLTPCIDLSGTINPEFSFWYHMLGQDMGELHVDVFDGTEWILDVMPAISGNQGSPWRNELIDLTQWSGQTITIRFRGITGFDYRSDIAIDDISLYESNGIEENISEVEMLIYPNPSSSGFTLEIEDPKPGMQIKLLDIHGRLIKSQAVKGERTFMGTQDISEGVYFVEIWEDQIRVGNERVMVNR